MQTTRFVLTNERIELLKKWHVVNNKRDIEQVREALQKTTYIYCPHNSDKEIKLTKAEAIKRLGEIAYLSGIGRSAFHWSATRDTLDGKGVVYFDSRRLFK